MCVYLFYNICIDTLADLASKEITPHEYTGNKNNNSNNSSNNSNIDDKNNNNITGYKVS